MPSFLEYIDEKGKLPACLTTSLAGYSAFCTSDMQAPKGNEYTVSDDRPVLEFYWDHRNDTAEELTHAVLTNTEMWGRNLTEVAGLESCVAEQLGLIRREGALAAFKNCL